MGKLSLKQIRLALKKEPWTLAALGLILVIIVAALLSSAQEQSDTDTQMPEYISSTVQQQSFDARHCILDECLAVEDLEYPIAALPIAVEDALRQAIEDEYRVRATYDAVIKKFGSKRPFNIIHRSEEQYINMLLSLFDKYGVTIPRDMGANAFVAYTTFEEACVLGAQAERESVVLYAETLIPLVAGYEDITRVFTDLLEASRDRHLQALEQCAL